MVERTKIKLFLSLLGFTLITCTKNDTPSTKLEYSTIEFLESPTGAIASLPYLTTGPDNALYLSWVETYGDSTKFNYATRKNDQWSSVEEISKGMDWFVNWADYPMIGIDNQGNMIAHFLSKSADDYFSYDVNIVRKPSDQGWSTPIVPHDDGTTTEHGFVTMLPYSGGFQMAWLDGRNTSSEGHEHKGAMTLRAAHLSIDGILSAEIALDNYVCDCCQTGGAITDSGPVVVYRNRSEQEIRDISIVRNVKGVWTDPEIIHNDHWEIAGCPVNGPKVDAIGNNLAVAWFTAPDNKPEVKVIFSNDGGEHFGEATVIDDQYPLGRVDIVMLDKKRAMVSWLCKENGQTLIKACIIHASGVVEPPIVVAESNEVRGSGFPQMSKINEVIYFAWTKVLSEGQSTVQLAFLR